MRRMAKAVKNRKVALGVVVWAACMMIWAIMAMAEDGNEDYSPASGAGYQYHFTVLNETGEPVDLLFWGARDWDRSTNPVKLFTGSSSSAADAFFSPCWASGGGDNVDETLAAYSARHGLDSRRQDSARFYLNQKSSAFDERKGAVTVQTGGGNLGFNYWKPVFYPSHPYAFMMEYYGNASDLFAVVLKNDNASKHFIWAGKTLSRSPNHKGAEVWASTCRSIFYSYYYQCAYNSFLFSSNGGWYVNTGGGSDDLLWAMLAGVGYKQLSLVNNNGMDRDVKRKTSSGDDSNESLTDTYLTPLEMRNVLNYLYQSGYWYAGKTDDPPQWYGIPWKDHLKGTSYKSPLAEQRERRDRDGFNQRASISNGLFWLYAAQLLNNSAVFQLADSDVEVCSQTVKNQFDLFFGSHKNLYVCQANVLPDPPGRKIDRIGLITDGAHFPFEAYFNNPTIQPEWETSVNAKLPDDRFTWTYNTGVVLAALGESYQANPTDETAKTYLIQNGVDLANAALDKLSWQQQDSAIAPPGVICEIETEMRGFPITQGGIANSIIIFKGLFALFIGDFAEALSMALENGAVGDSDMDRVVTCYKRISGVIRGTSNFLWDKWRDKPIAGWVYPDYRQPDVDGNEYDMRTQNEITEGSAAAAHITAGRLGRLDATLMSLGIISNPDQYLIYPLPSPSESEAEGPQ